MHKQSYEKSYILQCCPPFIDSYCEIAVKFYIPRSYVHKAITLGLLKILVFSVIKLKNYFLFLFYRNKRVMLSIITWYRHNDSAEFLSTFLIELICLLKFFVTS